MLVGHDWGGALAFDWAARHPGRVRGLAFLETIVRPMTWDDFPGPARPRLRRCEPPGIGEACAANIANLEIKDCGAAAHMAPEDQPEAIAAAIAGWATSHDLRSQPHPV